MKRRRNSVRRHPAETSAGHPCRAIIPVDGAKIRAKARKGYASAKRALERARAELVDYEQKDVPAYTAWTHREFGPLLTQIRDTTRLAGEKESLVAQVHQCGILGQMPFHRAYEEVLEARKSPPVNPWDQNGDGKDSGGAQGASEETDFEMGPDPEWTRGNPEEDKLYEEFQRMFEEMYGFRGGPPPRASFEPEPPPAPPRVKELYRALVRRLHPDTQEKMTPEKLELWHEVQEAYENNDEARLEVMLTLLEVEQKGTENAASVGLLFRIIERVKQTLREVRSQARRCKREFAWKFTQRTDVDRLAAQLERTFRNDLESWQLRLTMAEQQIQVWEREMARRKSSEAARANKRKTRVSRPPAGQAEFMFF